MDEKDGWELATRTMAMPKDTNINGDIFGGWLLSQMDIAGCAIGFKATLSRLTTVAIDKMTFIAPVHVGDFVCCYGRVEKLGTTSITIRVSAWAISPDSRQRRHVTEGVFVYVAIDEQGKPMKINKEDQRQS